MKGNKDYEIREN